MVEDVRDRGAPVAGTEWLAGENHGETGGTSLSTTSMYELSSV
jgi:hypothetical protein